MNEYRNPIDPADDDELRRALDRLADGDCPPEEEEALFLRLDDLPDGWKLCAAALLEARDLRAALRGWPGDREGTFERRPLAAASVEGVRESRTRLPAKTFAWYGGAALVAGLAFAAGLLLASRSTGSIAERERPTDVAHDGSGDEGRSPTGNIPDSTPAQRSEQEPDIVNVVYRSGDDAQSAPLPVYSSDETWARELDAALRESEADLALRREKLLAQGRDVERKVVLQSIVTPEGVRMLIPVETFQIVPVSLSSFH